MSEYRLIDRPYIAIEGIIGAGKSTLCQMLVEHWGGRGLYEDFEDNPFLPLFYQNPSQYAFPLEMAFLASRYRQLEQVVRPDLFGQPLISDFVFYKSLVFASNNLSGQELILYRKLFDIMFEQLPQPTLTVYLKVSIERALNQIAKRGRSYELNIEGEYLAKLDQAYMQYFTQLEQHTILIINADNLDFVTRRSEFEFLLHAISAQYTPGVHYASIER